MTARPRQVLASYSLWKVGVWIACVIALSGGILVVGASRGWSLPEGRYASLFPEAVIGSILGLLIAAGLLANLALARAVAIAAVGDELVLYFPLSRKRIPISGVTSVDVSTSALAPPRYGMLLKPSAIVVSQVILQGPGQPDVRFRTGLLRENAEEIASRIAAIRGQGGAR
jgi:hypothetical protein